MEDFIWEIQDFRHLNWSDTKLSPGTPGCFLKAYEEKDDFLPLDGDKNCSVILHDKDFLICFPNDAHRTAIQVNQPETIKKAIFKIQIS